MFVGLLAGLLGIGGGTVIVPILDITLPMQGVDFVVFHHMALATSMSNIMFTSVTSARSHSKRRSVRWDIVKGMTPGLLLGTLAGTFIVSGIPTAPLKIIFCVFLTYTAVQMLLDAKPKASYHLPGMLGLSLAGAFVGIVASFVGIGGGTLSVPYMTWCNVPMHKAIGTSAAIGFPIAVAGAVGYVVNGMGVEGLPGPHIGFIYLPALIGIAMASVCTAPLGAKLAHRLPVTRLKKAFACLLYVMAAQMAS